MSAGSPKGTIRLYPADDRDDDGPPFDQGESLGDSLEGMRKEKKMSHRLCALALKLAYHVTKTPEEFMTNAEGSDDQLWSVMPDVPSSSAKYEPVSRHPSRDEAVRALKKLEKDDLSSKLQEKENEKKEPAQQEQPEEPKTEAVVRSQLSKPVEEVPINEDMEQPEEPKTEPVIRAKPPEGMKPEEQAEATPKKRAASGDRRRWRSANEAAQEAWKRRG